MSDLVARFNSDSQLTAIELHQQLLVEFSYQGRRLHQVQLPELGLGAFEYHYGSFSHLPTSVDHNRFTFLNLRFNNQGRLLSFDERSAWGSFTSALDSFPTQYELANYVVWINEIGWPLRFESTHSSLDLQYVQGQPSIVQDTKQFSIPVTNDSSHQHIETNWWIWLALIGLLVFAIVIWYILKTRR